MFPFPIKYQKKTSRTIFLPFETVENASWSQLLFNLVEAQFFNLVISRDELIHMDPSLLTTALFLSIVLSISQNEKNELNCSR